MIAKRIVFVLLIAAVTGSVLFVLGVRPALAQPELEFGIGGSSVSFDGNPESSLSIFAHVLTITFTPVDGEPMLFGGCSIVKECFFFLETGMLKSHPTPKTWVFGSEGSSFTISDSSESTLFSGQLVGDLTVTTASPGTILVDLSGTPGKKLKDAFDIGGEFDGPLTGGFKENPCTPEGCINGSDFAGALLMKQRELVPEPSSALLFLSSLLPTMAVPMLRRRRLRPVTGCSLAS